MRRIKAAHCNRQLELVCLSQHLQETNERTNRFAHRLFAESVLLSLLFLDVSSSWAMCIRVNTVWATEQQQISLNRSTNSFSYSSRSDTDDSRDPKIDASCADRTETRSARAYEYCSTSRVTAIWMIKTCLEKAPPRIRQPWRLKW